MRNEVTRDNGNLGLTTSIVDAVPFDRQVIQRPQLQLIPLVFQQHAIPVSVCFEAIVTDLDCLAGLCRRSAEEFSSSDEARLENIFASPDKH